MNQSQHNFWVWVGGERIAVGRHSEFSVVCRDAVGGVSTLNGDSVGNIQL